MNNKGSSSTMLIVIIALVIGGVFYYFYTSGDKTAQDAVNGSGSLVTSTGIGGVPGIGGQFGGGDGVGSEELALLNRINSIKIDPKFFNDPVYLSLVDYTVPIPEQNVGRPNPFEPLYVPYVAPPAPAKTTTKKK